MGRSSGSYDHCLEIKRRLESAGFKEVGQIGVPEAPNGVFYFRDEIQQRLQAMPGNR